LTEEKRNGTPGRRRSDVHITRSTQARTWAMVITPVILTLLFGYLIKDRAGVEDKLDRLLSGQATMAQWRADMDRRISAMETWRDDFARTAPDRLCLQQRCDRLRNDIESLRLERRPPIGATPTDR